MVRQTKRRQILLHTAIDMQHTKPAPRKC